MNDDAPNGRTGIARMAHQINRYLWERDGDGLALALAEFIIEEKVEISERAQLTLLTAIRGAR